MTLAAESESDVASISLNKAPAEPDVPPWMFDSIFEIVFVRLSPVNRRSVSNDSTMLIFLSLITSKITERTIDVKLPEVGAIASKKP